MAQETGISCECGTFRGRLKKIDPASGTHLFCHCSDCQDFARFLGHGDRILDAQGGTALYQTRCAQLLIDAGGDRLASLHLTDQPTLRWYASCCRSPLFNTYANAKLPYLTVLVAAFSHGSAKSAMGPPLGHLHLADAPGNTSHLNVMSMGTMLRRFFPRYIKDVLSGDRRRSALFDPETLEPIANPHRLTSAERAAGAVV